MKTTFNILVVTIVLISFVLALSAFVFITPVEDRLNRDIKTIDNLSRVLASVQKEKEEIATLTEQVIENHSKAVDYINRLLQENKRLKEQLNRATLVRPPLET